MTRAALATALAAKILRPANPQEGHVADAKHNTTRFIVLARKPKWASRNERRVITTFVFEVRNIPAALYKALGGFATDGVDMTKLESYMVNGSFAATQFYADVQGHPKERRTSSSRSRSWNSSRGRSRCGYSASTPRTVFAKPSSSRKAQQAPAACPRQ